MQISLVVLYGLLTSIPLLGPASSVFSLRATFVDFVIPFILVNSGECFFHQVVCSQIG